MITTVLFDLDGTLLPMDQDKFIKAYFGGIAKKAAPYGYEPSELINTIWMGTAAMIKNDGSRSNEEAFWSSFSQSYGADSLKDTVIFDSFYEKEFAQVQKSCGYNPKVPMLIEKLKAAGLRIVLATNPIFPRVATDQRIRWAGLLPEDFELYTTYENSRHCKPYLEYYHDILKDLGLSAEECIMVGNDVSEDMIAGKLGMKVFLLTDCLINKDNEDISQYPHGDIDELYKFLHTRVREL